MSHFSSYTFFAFGIYFIRVPASDNGWSDSIFVFVSFLSFPLIDNWLRQKSTLCEKWLSWHWCQRFSYQAKYELPGWRKNTCIFRTTFSPERSSIVRQFFKNQLNWRLLSSVDTQSVGDFGKQAAGRRYM